MARTKRERKATGPQALVRAEKKATVLEALKAGATYTQIEQQHGIPRGTAHKYAMEAVTQFAPRDDVEAIRKQLFGASVERQQALRSRVLEGDPAAVAADLRESEHQAKLYGVFRPVEREQQQQTAIQVNLSFGTEQPEIIDQAPLELPPDT